MKSFSSDNYRLVTSQAVLVLVNSVLFLVNFIVQGCGASEISQNYLDSVPSSQISLSLN